MQLIIQLNKKESLDKKAEELAGKSIKDITKYADALDTEKLTTLAQHIFKRAVFASLPRTVAGDRLSDEAFEKFKTRYLGFITLGLKAKDKEENGIYSHWLLDKDQTSIEPHLQRGFVQGS